MGQRELYNVIKLLGGINVPQKAISQKFHELYPDHCGSRNRCGRIMRDLTRAGYVTWNQQTRSYTIIEPFPEPNIYVTKITEEEDLITS